MTATLQYRKMQTHKTKICSRCGNRSEETALECSECGYAFRMRFIPPIDERIIVPGSRPVTRDFFAERTWSAVLNFVIKSPIQKAKAVLSTLTPAAKIACLFALAGALALLLAPVLIWLLDLIPG